MKKLTESQIKEARRQISSLGGKATLQKHGKDHFKKLIQKRWGKNKKK